MQQLREQERHVIVVEAIVMIAAQHTVTNHNYPKSIVFLFGNGAVRAVTLSIIRDIVLKLMLKFRTHLILALVSIVGRNVLFAGWLVQGQHDGYQAK